MKRPRTTLICALLALSSSPQFFAHAQAPHSQAPSDKSCTLHGIIHDSDQQPIAGVAVFLQNKQNTLTSHTDTAGVYCFSKIEDGTYSLQAEMEGYEKAISSQVHLTPQEPSTIDLALKPVKAPASISQPQFFDEPHFTVAGVTDTTNSGGHGSSNALFRNRESLVKETASLGEPHSETTNTSSAANEAALRQEIALNPNSFDANAQLGRLLLDEKKSAEAISYLEQASNLNPRDYENNYELALAYFDNADYNRAHDQVASILHSQSEMHQDQAAPHHLLGEVCEKLNDPLEAVHQYQRAAELDPSETNFFDWGTELLLHHAAEPAIEIFTKGNRLFPQSVRMLTALAAAWYESGSFEKAAQRLVQASDLDPGDPTPYLFMGKMQATEAVLSVSVAESLQRFAKLHPENALANYYYAVSLSKPVSADDNVANRAQVKSLLLKSVQLDPKLAPGYLQLGIVYAEEQDLAQAISAYQQAISIDPNLEQAHYRLAQAYRQAGESANAHDEMQLYEKIAKKNADETERERSEMRQFTYRLQEPPSAPH
jgi:tetratricopeptide (TPR) repeat protein